MRIKYLSCILAIFALDGCAGLTQMQDTISKFDQGAHSVATGQMAYFREVQAADCNNQFYTAAYNFSINQSNNLDLSGRCNPTVLDSDQIKIRQALMDSLTLYVDKIQTLSTSDDNKTLDANSKDLALQVNGIAKSHGFASGLSLADGVEAAVISITEMALDQRRFKDIKGAAAAMNPHVRRVVEALKAENTAYAITMASKMNALEPELHTALLEARNTPIQACQESCKRQHHKGAALNSCMKGCSYAGARSLLDVIAAREVIRTVNPLGASPVSIAEGSEDVKLDPANVAVRLNAALDALANANDALANAGTGGTIAAVNDLAARARHANELLTSIGK
jgi:hypothetical protein